MSPCRKRRHLPVPPNPHQPVFRIVRSSAKPRERTCSRHRETGASQRPESIRGLNAFRHRNRYSVDGMLVWTESHHHEIAEKAVDEVPGFDELRLPDDRHAQSRPLLLWREHFDVRIAPSL